MFLTTNKELQFAKPEYIQTANASYAAFGNETDSTIISFQSRSFEVETEITSHITAHLSISIGQDGCGNTPDDMDLFLSLRHISPDGAEVLYTGSMGEGVSLSGGSLRVSLRKVNSQHSDHRPWLPRRDYLSTDVLPVHPNEVYADDIEIWPTNVAVDVGGRLALDISSREWDFGFTPTLMTGNALTEVTEEMTISSSELLKRFAAETIFTLALNTSTT